ncbi:Hypothetical protein, putative [Bodo saltans]|uniref:Protein kinase domain-containing protein n=1 Tax=Bodo saltans TaxID=75058 RepID=A0A0S4ILJ3_BODSA|nr:Hypothetical protein, putative [Bodo saltans]|eukprot:CUE71397.1 Hypothetical protein, putative [Bodo saltans]
MYVFFPALMRCIDIDFSELAVFSPFDCRQVHLSFRFATMIPQPPVAPPQQLPRRSPRLPSVRARLLVGLMLFAVLFVWWRLHSIAAAQLDTNNARNWRPGGSLIDRSRHLNELLVHSTQPHHPTNHTITTGRGNRTTHMEHPTPEQFETIMLRTVLNVLFEDETLWGASATSILQHHSRLAVACDFGNHSLNKVCSTFFAQTLRKRRSFAVVPLITKPLSKKRKSSELSLPQHKWLIAPADISAALPSHAQKMKANIIERLHATQQQSINVTQLTRVLASSTPAVRECLRSVEPLGMLLGSHATTQRQKTPSARIVSAKSLMSAGASDVVASSRLHAVFHSASVVIISLDDDVSLLDGPSPLLDAIAAQFEAPAVAAACSFASAHDLDDALEGPVAVFVRCNDTEPASPACDTDDVVQGARDAELAPLCSTSPAPLHITAALKWGTKTAIFRGHLGNVSVAVKMFHVDQYATFSGFHTMVALPSRSPYINFPTSSCFDPSTEAIYQVQPFLGKGKNLLQFMKAEGKKLPWPLRLELAQQLLCAFQHLHEHPSGFVTFDDNHPEQYYVTEEKDSNGDRHLRLTMVDVDTLQVGDVAPVTNTPTPTTVNTTTYRNPSDVRIKCRCFYCHGRSNCLFMNTLKGYRACGQGPDDSTHGDREDLSRVMPGKLCDGHNDMWFIAQLFYLIGKGSVAWAQAAHVDVLSRLEAGTVPPLSLESEPDFSKLVNDLFHFRVTVEEALMVVDGLCKAHPGCQREGDESSVCRFPVEVGVRPYSTPITLWRGAKGVVNEAIRE